MKLRDNIQYSKTTTHFMQGNCMRFKNLNYSPTVQNSTLYCRLREMNQLKKTSIQFATKQYCKKDVTRVKDGPAGIRIFTNRIDPIYTHYGQQLAGEVEYNLGPKIYSSHEEILKNNKDIQPYEELFDKKGRTIQNDYRYKMELFSKYLTEMNDKYSLKAKNIDELKEKIKNIQNQQNTTNFYYKFNDCKFFELAQEINDIKQQYDSFNQDEYGFNKLMPFKLLVDKKYAHKLIRSEIKKQDSPFERSINLSTSDRKAKRILEKKTQLDYYQMQTEYMKNPLGQRRHAYIDKELIESYNKSNYICENNLSIKQNFTNPQSQSTLMKIKKIGQRQSFKEKRSHQDQFSNHSFTSQSSNESKDKIYLNPLDPAIASSNIARESVLELNQNKSKEKQNGFQDKLVDYFNFNNQVDKLAKQVLKRNTEFDIEYQSLEEIIKKNKKIQNKILKKIL